LSLLEFKPSGLQAGGLTIAPQGPLELKFSACLKMLLFILLAITFSTKLDIFNYKAWSSIMSSGEQLG